MGKFKKQVTAVFLVVFTLIKVSPIYYRYQFISAPQSNNAKIAAKHVNEKTNRNRLVRVYKSFVDKNSFISVPKINFSGSPFRLFFTGISLLLLMARYQLAPSSYLYHTSDIHLLQGVFRLWRSGPFKYRPFFNNYNARYIFARMPLAEFQ